MRKIELSRGKVAIVDDDDYQWLNQWKWYCAHGYAFRKYWDKEKKKYCGIFMHQLINKTPKGLVTDHINRNRLDNRRKNLRSITPHQNRFNLSLGIRNKSGVIGVYLPKGRNKYRAFIKYNCKFIHLGNFSLLKDAILARKEAEHKYYAL